MAVRLQSHRASKPNEGRRFQQVLFLCTVLSLTMVQMTLWMAWNIISSAFPLDLYLPTRLPVVLTPLESGGRPANSTVRLDQPFRILLGIFSHNKGSKGKLQRDLVRRTYLSLPLFLERFDITTIPLRHARICSLHDYRQKTIQQPEQCQILYTFVIGGNSPENNAPREYLGSATHGSSLTIQVSDPEPDTVYLNVEDDMDFRKTSTWLQYASTEVPTEINIVAKVDAETLLYPTIFLQEIEAAWTTPDTLIVGGSEIKNNGKHDSAHRGVLFLSRQLAQNVSGNQHTTDWKAIQSSKNIEKGQLVKAVGNADVTWLEVPEGTAWINRKEMKDKQGFHMKWGDYVMKLIAHDRLIKMEQKYGECPEPDLHGRDRIFLDTIPMTVAKQLFSALLAQKNSFCKNNSNDL